jgi:hypothetical protein
MGKTENIARHGSVGARLRKATGGGYKRVQLGRYPGLTAIVPTEAPRLWFHPRAPPPSMFLDKHVCGSGTP